MFECWALKKTIWISIRKLKKHEFHTTIRKLSPDENTWPNRFKILGNIEADAIKAFLRSLSAILISYLMLTSLRSGNSLTLRVSNFEASVPASYFLAASSFLFLITAVLFCHLLVAMTLKADESKKILLSGFSAATFDLIAGKKEDVSLGMPIFTNLFLRQLIPISGLLAIAYLVCMILALMPIGAFGYFLVIEQLILLNEGSIFLSEAISLWGGVALTCFSFCYLFLFNVPLPTRKNASYIRRNFLYRISTQSPHPQQERWIED